MTSKYNGRELPSEGSAIDYKDGKFSVPERPIIPFIEGDGTGRDIWKAASCVVDAAVEQAYGGRRKIIWYEVFAGEKAKELFGSWLPDDTVAAFRDLRLGIKGPLTTPIGGGIRSLNVALRQSLDLYACVRPVRYFPGTPSPVKHPEQMDLVIFRENTEDVYAGIEWKQGSAEAAKLIEFLNTEMLAGTKKQIRLDSGVGIKPISVTGTKRLVRMAIEFALRKKRPSVTLVHKGNIQKFTEGAFRQWGYEVATEEYRQQIVTERESWILGNREAHPEATLEQQAAMLEPGLEFAPEDYRRAIRDEVAAVLAKLEATHGHGQWKQKLLVNDRIADSVFQQVVTRAGEYSVLATPNLNGDYLSDACAAQIGGLGIAPGANIGAGYAIFEATHGTAPKYADKNVINPCSVILSAAMMLEFMGWGEAAQRIEQGVERTIAAKRVTYDFARMMDDATQLGTREFASAIIENMGTRA